MIVKDYGVKKLMYRATLYDDGRFQLQVHHANKPVREYIGQHSDDPRYFWERRADYAKNNLAAKRHLAEVMEDFPSQFEEGQAAIVFR